MTRYANVFSSESLHEMQLRLGEELYAFGLIVSGAIPADPARRDLLCERIRDAVDRALSPLEAEGLVLGVMALRTEKPE